MNFSHLSLKCYPTRVIENVKNNNKQKQNKTKKSIPFFFEWLPRGVQETPNTYSLWLLPFAEDIMRFRNGA